MALTPEMEAVNEIQALIKEADVLVREQIDGLERSLAEGQSLEVRPLEVVKAMREWRDDLQRAFDDTMVEMIFELAVKELEARERRR